MPFSEHPRVVCLRLELHGCRESSKFTLDKSVDLFISIINVQGGIAAYSSPVPDLLGNGSSQPVLWEEQNQGLLTDGSFGLQDIHTNTILTYGTLNTFYNLFVVSDPFPLKEKDALSSLPVCAVASPLEWTIRLGFCLFSIIFYRGRVDELEEKRRRETSRIGLQV